jgi:hypothetical protein
MTRHDRVPENGGTLYTEEVNVSSIDLNGHDTLLSVVIDPKTREVTGVSFNLRALARKRVPAFMQPGVLRILLQIF